MLISGLEAHHAHMLDGRFVSLYDRMPPVEMRELHSAFTPDYATLLLADKIVMDEQSFSRLQFSSHPLYRTVSETLRSLHREGHVELVDFESTLRAHEGVLQTMLEFDMRVLDEWVRPLRNSLATWTQFAQQTQKRFREEESEDEALFMAMGMLHLVANRIAGQRAVADMMLEEALESSRKRRRKEYRDILRKTLRPYLHYVNCNLVLSHAYSSGFHDWSDFQPFYERKFMPIGQESTDVESRADKVRQLFTVPFPEFAIRNTDQLVRAVNDRRIKDLRQLVAEAANGNVTFDEEFAKRTLTEVLHAERHWNRWRNITSYVTIPIGQIPWVGAVFQKAIEEVAGRVLETHFQKDHRWYYLLSETVDVEANG